ncbi:MAG: hypothetical protein VYE40_04160 [Myxococcota bacterium]|nr:hypothetical protein [Myxococcota bacterium]MEC9440281.1 hypothetical protein [Myxococcota bacterium]
MANKKKQSADEIVDNLAEEMGVKDEKPDESKDDLAADLGGLFGVSSKKKKKKKKEEPKAEEPPAKEEESSDDDASEEEEPAAEEAAEGADSSDEEEEESAFDAISDAISSSLGEDDEEEEEEEKPKKKAATKKPAKKPEDKPAKKKSEGIDGIFAPAGGGGGGEPMVVDDDPYLDEDDLGGASAGGANKGLIGVIVVLVLALVGVVLGTTSVGKDIMLVFKGEYRAQKDADKAAQEEAFKAAQEAALPKFGNLSILGSPKYASITHNGETYYGEISAGMREMQLNPGYSNIGNLPIKEKQVITVSAPGFTPKTFEITEGMWQGGQGGAYSYALTATLVPVDMWAGNEFDARMGSDTENEFFGKMVIKTVPEGATVMLNNKPLLDEKGEPLKTPVSIEKNYVKDDKGKLEEVPIKVDTVFDEGHKLVVSFPDQPDMPAYANQINRQLWACNKKAEDEIKKLPEGHSIQMECDYVYEKTIDFNQIKAFKKRMEEKRKEIEEYNKKVKDLRAKQLEGKELDPSAVEAVQK